MTDALICIAFSVLATSATLIPLHDPDLWWLSWLLTMAACAVAYFGGAIAAIAAFDRRR